MPTKDELLSEFKNSLKHCLGVLESAMTDPMQFERLKELVPKLNFTGRDSDGLPGPSREEYMEPLLNAYYFARYGLSYAFEYSVIYDAILRDIAQSDDPSEINVASFGCGSMIDAWALAYSKMKLSETTHIPTMREIGLSYRGFDGAAWEVYFAGAKSVEYDANGNSTGRPARVNECFVTYDDSGNKVMNMPWINGFTAAGEGVDIAEVFTDPQYQSVIGDCNILFFPKILNELSAKKLEAIISGIREMAEKGCFKKKEIYIAISHSYNALHNGHALRCAGRMIEVLNYHNEYSISGNILERSPLYSTNFGIRGFELSPGVNSEGEADKAYEFHKFVDDYGKHSSYIDVLDYAFGGQIKRDITAFDADRLEDKDIPGYKRMISRATHIAMLIIKLTKVS
ncbi:hypothetical protein SAMN02910292_01222 [Lachnospiraceae bacterium XBB2008]|nr:hypothetical protein SAMN02910292_01222 [Lachnospiraceae bacterium XBB2008]